MTTILTATMTLSNAQYSNDDQQVPDSNSSGVVVPAVNSGIVRTHLPDFTSLLLDPQKFMSSGESISALNTPELIQSLELNYPLDSYSAAPSLMDSGYWEEGSGIYDGDDGMKDSKLIPTSAAPRPTSLPLAPSQALPLPAQYGLSPVGGSTPCSTSTAAEPCSPMSSDPFDVEQTSLEQMGQDMEEKLDSICRNLWIPKDPHYWKPSHVLKWVNWVLTEQYNIPSVAGGGQSYLAGMEGTSLCMLTRDQLVQRTSAEVGGLLYVDLEWWRAASGSMECPQQPLPTYMVLGNSCSSMTNTSSSSSSSTSSTSSPSDSSPMFTSTISSSTTSLSSAESVMLQQQQTTSSEIPTPVLADYQLKQSLYQINSEVEQHQQQQQHYSSFLSSIPQWEEGVMVKSSDSSSLSASMYNNSSSSSSSSQLMDVSDIVKQEQEDSEEDQVLEEEEEAVMGGAEEKRRYVSHSKHTIHLWQFLKNLLQSPERYGNCIKWLDHAKGIFKIENSKVVATLWGQRKNRPAMNYDKLSRSIRQYYKKGIIKKTTHSKRLVYQFQPSYL